jgi:hypothetical protein
MVSVVCIGAVLLAAGELMFAWTCTPNVHWIWPLIAGSEYHLAGVRLDAMRLDESAKNRLSKNGEQVAGPDAQECETSDTGLHSIFWNVYIGVVYGILYLCFVAYPIVFRQERGWSAGIAGLAFLGIGTGNLLT